MASRKDIDLYIPEEQTATLLFTKPGPDDPDTGKTTEVTVMWMEVKADLTFDDRSALFWDKDDLEDELDVDGNPVLDTDGQPKKKPLDDETIWDRLAPFVLNWSVGRRGEDGKPEPEPAPAVAGGKQFGLINPLYVQKLLNDLRFRSTGKLDTDFLAG